MPLKLVRKPDFGKIIEGMARAEEKFLTDIADEAVELHEEIVDNWSNPPEFEVAVTRKRFRITTEVKPKGDKEAVENWWRVNNGTGQRAGGSAYEITPKKPGGVLSFNLGYKPKTTPRSHGGPGVADGPRVFVKKVLHKGIKPRHFDKRVRRMLKKKYARKGAAILIRQIKRIVHRR